MPSRSVEAKMDRLEILMYKGLRRYHVTTMSGALVEYLHTPSLLNILCAFSSRIIPIFFIKQINS